MDLVTVLGLFIGIGGIAGGMLLEGGHLGSILQLTAAIIVFGGTIGAVLVSTTREDLATAFGLLGLAFRDEKEADVEFIGQELIESAQLARKDTILALERRINNFSFPFMRNVFRFVIDGVDHKVMRDIFESQILMEEENLMAGAKVFSDAGGYAPTIGIIGAVLGLIHVMAHLSDTTKLGQGIAVAFVATIYGVGSANLVFLPIATKIKRKIRLQIDAKVMVLEGAIGILNGLNPYVIEEKVRSFTAVDGKLSEKLAVPKASKSEAA